MVLQELQSGYRIAKKHQAQYPEFVKQHKDQYKQVADTKAANAHLQTGYENQMLDNMNTKAHEVNYQLNNLHERFVVNENTFNKIADNNREQIHEVQKAQSDVSFLRNRQALRKLIMAILIVLLGLIDFAFLIARVRRFF